MTEDEWLKSEDVERKLIALPHDTERKEVLFACACCRLIWNDLPADVCRTTVKVCEDYSDGLTTIEQVQAARKATEQVLKTLEQEATKAASPPESVYRWGLYWSAYAPVCATRSRAGASWQTAEAVIQADDHLRRPFQASSRAQKRILALIDEVYGNPFRPITLAPEGLTPQAKHLAQSIYEERAFERLPILADALEEAGCNSEEVLRHLRCRGEHQKGCWGLDLVLGRE